MTIHYYTNEYNVQPNLNAACSGCGALIMRHEKSERYRIRDRRMRDGHRIEVRHLHCRPDWVPKVKRRIPRDEHGRFMSTYSGPGVGREVYWDALKDLPIGTLVIGTGNQVTYRIGSPTHMTCTEVPEDQPGWMSDRVGGTYTHSEINGSFRILRVGPRRR